MKSLENNLREPGRVLVANAPEELDALLLGQAAAALSKDAESAPAAILHVARDDARVARLAEQLAFFAPEVEVIVLPAWDCLPYDRVSPHRDVMAQRIDALTSLIDAEPAEAGRIVLTTVNALLQRVPPRAAFAGRSLSAKLGERLDPAELTDYFARNGYLRSDTVGEPGEYAVRGGIVDVFPPGAEQPLRLDFFGDELDSVRSFDPMSQRTTGKLDGMSLKPVSEVVLDEESITRFRGGYLATFGAVRGEDPLYEAVTAGRLHPGMEHWLPLFHETMETLFDYLPGRGGQPRPSGRRGARRAARDHCRLLRGPPHAAGQQGNRWPDLQAVGAGPPLSWCQGLGRAAGRAPGRAALALRRARGFRGRTRCRRPPAARLRRGARRRRGHGLRSGLRPRRGGAGGPDGAW